MKNKILYLIILSLLTSAPSFAFWGLHSKTTNEQSTDLEQEQQVQYESKLTLATQMRFDAFRDAQITVTPNIPDDRLNVKIYKLSKNERYLQKVRIPKAKLTEYTNGSYDIKFKDTPDTIYRYDKDGQLTGFVILTNNGKVPFISYHYDVNGQLTEIEIKPQFYRSYVYDLNGVLTKYIIDNKVYDVNGNMLLRRKRAF